jgi:His/Glu/Gln/Arg/opine family amino acid ABC transporter permease subunit
VNFEFLLAPSTLSPSFTNLDLMLMGWGRTVAAFLAAMGIALAVGFPLGVVRSLPGISIASRIVAGYVEIFRNIPLLVQLFLWFFVLPELVPSPVGWWLKRGLENAEYWNLVVALGLFMSARVIELTRAGIGSLGTGQLEGDPPTGAADHPATADDGVFQLHKGHFGWPDCGLHRTHAAHARDIREHVPNFRNLCDSDLDLRSQHSERCPDVTAS